MEAIAVLAIIIGIALVLHAMHEWHLYRQESRMLAVEECEAMARLDEDTHPDPCPAAVAYRQWIEQSGVRIMQDDFEDETLPGTRQS